MHSIIHTSRKHHHSKAVDRLSLKHMPTRSTSLLIEVGIDRVGEILTAIIGNYEDTIQNAWVEILENKPETEDEVRSIAAKCKRRSIQEHIAKQCREVSGYKPLKGWRNRLHGEDACIFDTIGVVDETLATLSGEESRIGYRAIPRRGKKRDSQVFVACWSWVAYLRGQP